ncbi:hypothetical protein AK812_SmicGene3443 [Symbiodinium microadriaticum]|uniref:Uncharacterized protein n=1 Tax=Symbiodinium microadriaticum TaxID=2951 RepID=A0A1Q9EYU4_SYMMI|nr:hypothetical protein AK812_SmicGene3443 [Symbiodinium microadriaticum]
MSRKLCLLAAAAAVLLRAGCFVGGRLFPSRVPRHSAAAALVQEQLIEPVTDFAGNGTAFALSDTMLIDAVPEIKTTKYEVPTFSPGFVVDGVISTADCQQLVQLCEDIGFRTRWSQDAQLERTNSLEARLVAVEEGPGRGDMMTGKGTDKGHSFLEGVSVLAHCDNIKPGDGALLLLDARGSEVGNCPQARETVTVQDHSLGGAPEQDAGDGFPTLPVLKNTYKDSEAIKAQIALRRETRDPSFYEAKYTRLDGICYEAVLTYQKKVVLLPKVASPEGPGDLRGSCIPLAGRDSLVFLGVPINQVNTPDLMLAHPLRKMNNAYFGMKKLLDRAETDHRTKAVLFESYIASKWTWCPAWQVTWLTRIWTYMGHLARLRYRQIRHPHEPEYWEWLAKDREAWRAMLPRWIASWGVGAALPDSTEYMAGRQLVVLEKGIAALRPRRDALDGLYRKGVVHLQPWRADARSTLTVWVTHTPGDIAAGVYFFRPKVKAPETPVVHVGLRPTQQGVEPFAVLNFVCKVLELLYLTEPLGSPRIVLPAHLLPKSALEGMQDSRNTEAARFTRIGEEVGLLDKLSLTPKRLPDRCSGLYLGLNGQRASSRRYPLTTRLCTKFVTQWMPDTKFTTITVHDNVATPPHMDARNSEVPGGLVALTNSFIGGELWLEHDRGTSAMTIKGKMKLGMKVDLTNPFAFSAKTVLHATVPWVGDRWILAAYSISNVAANLGPVFTPNMDWGAVTCVLVVAATVVLTSTLRQLLGELRAMRIQSEAWSRIHDNATRQSGLLDEVLAESVYIRKKMNDALGSLFGGLEIRRNLQALQHMHDLLQTLHDRRRDVAEVHHVGFLRHRLGEITDKIEEIQHAVEVMQNSLDALHESLPAPLVSLD